MPTAPISTYDHRLFAQVTVLARAVHGTPGRTRLYVLAAAIALVIIATAAMQVRLNAWNQPFYDAIQRRDVPEFVRQLGVFAIIAGVLLVLNVAQTGFNQLIRVRLRQLATLDLIDTWMTGKRATRISRAGDIGVNPDQRIQSDAQTLTEGTTDLGIGLVQSSVLLASFIGVLWVLSEGIVIPIRGHDLAIPGYMVWAALLYALTSSLLSWRVGHPLVRLGADRYAREAEFRAALVQGSERAEGIALGNAEEQTRQGLVGHLDALVVILRQMAMARVRLTWVTAGTGWIGLVFPIVVAAPGYFAGRLSFGEMMMAVGAFNQVQQSLRWFVDNTSSIADWRAALLRVMNFRKALIDLDDVEAGAGLVERREDPGGRFALDDLKVETRHGCVSLDPARFEVGAGERALVLGKPNSGRSSLFLAIAGLWSAGSGSIAVPPAAEVAYLTQRPFLPPGRLRDAIAPAGEAPDDDALRAALTRAGLEDICGALDTVGRWDRDLGLGQQERLRFAQLLLARPKWLICDEGLDLVDETNRQTFLSILADELAESAVVNISQRREPADFYGKVAQTVLSASRADRPEGRTAAG